VWRVGDTVTRLVSRRSAVSPSVRTRIQAWGRRPRLLGEDSSSESPGVEDRYVVFFLLSGSHVRVGVACLESSRPRCDSLSLLGYVPCRTHRDASRLRRHCLASWESLRVQWSKPWLDVTAAPTSFFGWLRSLDGFETSAHAWGRRSV
jgi:hypothetical protein